MCDVEGLECLRGKDITKRGGEVKFTQGFLDNDFPYAGSAHKREIVRVSDCCTCYLAQTASSFNHHKSTCVSNNKFILGRLPVLKQCQEVARRNLLICESCLVRHRVFVRRVAFGMQ